MKQLASALRGMHARGLIHRDVKLENILMKTAERDSDIRLADFGLAIQRSDEELMRTMCGTCQIQKIYIESVYLIC
jgi:serine/threonine protein kinase